MGLRDLMLKREYRSNRDRVVQKFFIPCLTDAVLYQRAVGYFRSSLLVDISKGIGPMSEAGGKIQLIASPYLTDEDVEAIKKGYAERDTVIENAVLSQLTDEPEGYFSSERLNLLANLIAKGTLDIKIAFMETPNGIGMYHEKMGIILDGNGDKIAFSGSMNDTSTAMKDNCDIIDVYRGWGDGSEQDWVNLKQNAFNSLWGDTEPQIKVLHFPKVNESIMEKYLVKAPNFHVDAEQFPELDTEPLYLSMAQENASNASHAMHDKQAPFGARVPDDVHYYDYQQNAIDMWATENYRGIFDMATGTGKTLTGLGAVSRLSEDLHDNLAVIISCPYQHLVEQWVEDIVRFNIKPIVGYGSSAQKDWKKRLENAIREQKIRNDKPFFCFVTTNATFAKPYVQEQISKIHSPILLVVDEAHNFGARSYAACLDDRFTYRLALSATLDRHRDEEGTALLYNFFGRKCIEYTLEKAIQEDKLTRYKYYPVLVHLNEEELMRYEDLSFKMSKYVTKDKHGKIKLSKQGEILALERSRVVAGASQKLRKLREVIEPYRNEYNLLVYCGATQVINEKADFSDEADEGEIRQIEAVIDILGNEMGMAVARFTSMEDIETRASIISHYQNGAGLQAIVAIKCLDEGVNIPGIKTAFILASTTNPKEYIQRRGRVLRKSSGKAFAEIYDFVTLPRPLDEVSSLTVEQMKRDLSLVKKELGRIKEFVDLSMNPMDAQNLIWDIRETYNITDDIEDYEGGII